MGPKGNMFVIGGGPRNLCYNTSTANWTTFPGIPGIQHGCKVSAVMSPDYQTIYATSIDDRKQLLWRYNIKEASWCSFGEQTLSCKRGHSTGGLAISADGTRIFSLGGKCNPRWGNHGYHLHASTTVAYFNLPSNL